jgi:hypothetical protein
MGLSTYITPRDDISPSGENLEYVPVLFEQKLLPHLGKNNK